MKTPSLPPLRSDNVMKNIGIGLLILLTVVSLVGFYNRPNETTQDVSLSRVAQEINNGQVKSITVDQADVNVALKNSSLHLVTQKEPDASITDTMKNLGVSQDQLRGIEIVIKKPSGLSYWLAVLLPTLLHDAQCAKCGQSSYDIWPDSY